MKKWIELDSSFYWMVATEFSEDSHYGWVLELVSQHWVGSEFTDRPIWKHWLTITVPRSVDTATAFLHIGGGSIHDLPPTGPTERFLKLALHARSVVVELWQVPNQPVRFTDNPQALYSEDAFIAFLLSQFDGDIETLPRFPMVRSAVAGMTAAQQCLTKYAEQNAHVRRFVVSGSSKRGWVAWLVGLMDDRVVGIVPVVINILNVSASVRHHWKSLGFFSAALQPYVDNSVIPYGIGGPAIEAAIAIEDPFSYLPSERMRIPKLVIVSSGDEYFPVDSTRFYFSDLPATKHLRVLPNAGHSPLGTDVNDTIASWYRAVSRDEPLPTCEFSYPDQESIVFCGSDRPAGVSLWIATNPVARDFRLSAIGEAGFVEANVTPDASGRYSVSVLPPCEGFTAYFMEVRFSSGGDTLKFTSEVRVLPDLMPFDWPTPHEIQHDD